MFITPAYAQTAGAAGGMGFGSIGIFVAIFAIMYFLIIRPQRQQMKKRQQLLNSVRRGDTVVTGGGVIGKVVKVYDETGELDVEIAENTRIRILRSTVADVRSKSEPVAESKPSVAPAKAKSARAVKKTTKTVSKTDTKTDSK